MSAVTAHAVWKDLPGLIIARVVSPLWFLSRLGPVMGTRRW